MKPLLDSLRSQRRHVLESVAGLDVSTLHRPILPSGWHCLGLINHLAIDVERFWFGCVITGRPLPSRSWAWDAPADLAVLDLYRAECAASDDVLATVALSDPPRWWPDFFGDYRLHTVEEILLHVITETACHAGHLDAARELIDGHQHLTIPVDHGPRDRDQPEEERPRAW
jgi:hypothetical protein